mgnify:CR=1 FL=1
MKLDPKILAVTNDMDLEFDQPGPSGLQNAPSDPRINRKSPTPDDVFGNDPLDSDDAAMSPAELPADDTFLLSDVETDEDQQPSNSLNKPKVNVKSDKKLKYFTLARILFIFFNIIFQKDYKLDTKTVPNFSL